MGLLLFARRVVEYSRKGTRCFKLLQPILLTRGRELRYYVNYLQKAKINPHCFK